MYAIETLWLPILLSAIAVFVASSVIHMATPWHKNDFSKVPDENAVMSALRSFAIPYGEYMMPKAGSMNEMKSPEYKAKMTSGPNLIMTVMRPGPMSMSKFMIQWFVYVLVVSIAVGCLASATVVHGALSHRVFHVVGFTAFLTYSAAIWPFSIWYQRPWMTTIRSTIDGLIFALITGGIFVQFWPK
ncbi:MAG TPA: hypothetical protein VGL65_09845 [Gemmatimonadales bacterium]|jgi:hypothetical protein